MSNRDEVALNATKRIIKIISAPGPANQQQAKIQVLLIDLLEKHSAPPAAAHGDERAAFDKWFDDYSLDIRMNGGTINKRQMLAAWQAHAAIDAAMRAHARPCHRTNEACRMNTIHLTLTRGDPVAINVARIDAVAETGFGANVFVGGANDPFSVKDSYSDVITKIVEVEWTK